MTHITAVPIPPTKRAWLMWLGAGVALAACGGVALAVKGTQSAVVAKGTNEQFLAWNSRNAGVITTASGLQYKVVKKGEGVSPADSDVALVSYRGVLRDGRVFDENPRAPLPVNGVVPGFSEALKLTSKGGQYRFWIPSALGYGAKGAGDPSQAASIPPDSLLIFDIGLLDFKSMAEIQAAQQQMQQMQAQGQLPPQGAPPQSAPPQGVRPQGVPQGPAPAGPNR